MTIDDLYKLYQSLADLIRRHIHDDIETNKLPVSSLKPTGTTGQVLISNGTSESPSFQDIGNTAVAGRMWRSGSQSVNASSDTQVLLNTEVFDSVGITADTGNSQFVVETDGYYFVDGQVTYDSPESGKLLTVSILVNGSQKGYHALYTASANITSVHVSSLLKLVAGDTVSLYTFHVNTGAEDLSFSNEATTYLSIHKI